MQEFAIGHEPLSLDQVHQLLHSDTHLVLAPEAIAAIDACRDYLDQAIEHREEPVYGINTGFGALCSVKIAAEDLAALQRNLVLSHACGAGEPVAPELVKAMLLLKVLSLSRGHSGVQRITVQRLLDFYNANVLPVVYEFGSLGASGDLAPLAHLCMPLMGEGEVWIQGIRQPASVVLERMGWEPITLASKEGLALLNGTQFMSAFGVVLLHQTGKLLDWAEALTALSIDAFDGRIEPFNALLHHIRPHRGQITTATHIRNYLEGSEIARQPKAHVQDPYSFRCAPQVIGASRDAWNYVCSVFETELNAVTDNPNIFPEEDLILSGGNFHGQPLAMALDYLCLAIHELASFSERRIYQLVNGKRGLPPFLAPNPGLHSGFMIPQYTAASLVSRNKGLCMPASADTIDSSAGQEDHVSMGANAATKAWQVLRNARQVLGIELLTAAQAIEFRRPLRSSERLERILADFRKEIPFMAEDRYLHPDLVKAEAFLRTYSPS